MSFKRLQNKVGVDFLEACMEFLDAKVEIKGLENLPENGKCTFVSNHPLGGQDGVALGYILGNITMVMYAIWSMIC